MHIVNLAQASGAVFILIEIMTDRDGNIVMNAAQAAAWRKWVANIPPAVHIMAMDEHGVMMEAQRETVQRFVIFSEYYKKASQRSCVTIVGSSRSTSSSLERRQGPSGCATPF